MRFAPQNWDVQTLKSGEGWTPSGRILLFEFENYAERLKLRLTIGPGPEVVRQGLFDMAQSHQPPFRLASKSLYKKWNTIYDKSFLTPKNYEDTDDTDLANEIRIHWAKFVKNDLPLIMEVIEAQQWIHNALTPQ